MLQVANHGGSVAGNRLGAAWADARGAFADGYKYRQATADDFQVPEDEDGDEGSDEEGGKRRHVREEKQGSGWETEEGVPTSDETKEELGSQGEGGKAKARGRFAGNNENDQDLFAISYQKTALRRLVRTPSPASSSSESTPSSNDLSEARRRLRRLDGDHTGDSRGSSQGPVPSDDSVDLLTRVHGWIGVRRPRPRAGPGRPSDDSNLSLQPEVA